STGLATAWNPNANSTVWSLALDGNTLYVGGDFTNIGGAARNRIAALDVSTGTATSWNPSSDGSVKTVLVPHYDDDFYFIFAGGDFTNIGGSNRNRLAVLNKSGVAESWDPNANGT